VWNSRRTRRPVAARPKRPAPRIPAFEIMASGLRPCFLVVRNDTFSMPDFFGPLLARFNAGLRAP
jgi:hypothetical protein